MTVFIDSNIWCYYFDESAEEHLAVTEVVNELLDEERIYINNIVLMEVAHFLVKNLGGKKGEKSMEKFLSYPFNIVDVNYSLTTDSIEILAEEHQTGIGGRDATIIATVEKEDIDELVTHDKAFRKIDGLNISDPVEP